MTTLYNLSDIIGELIFNLFQPIHARLGTPLACVTSVLLLIILLGCKLLGPTIWKIILSWVNKETNSRPVGVKKYPEGKNNATRCYMTTREKYIGLVMVISIIIGLSIFIVKFNSTHVTYFTDYVERNNIPEGIFPLTEQQAASRSNYYKIISENGRVRRLEHCNSAGKLINHKNAWHQERPAAMELIYDESGNVKERIHWDSERRKIALLRFEPGFITFCRNTDNMGTMPTSAAMMTQVNMDSNDSPGIKKAAIDRYAIQREQSGDNKGIITRETYRSTYIPEEKLGLDGDGLLGRSYTLDDMGRQKNIDYLTLQDLASPVLGETQTGIGGYDLTYNKLGLVKKVIYHNKSKGRALNQQHWSEIRIKYNEQGNEIERSFYGVDGNPCLTNRRTAQIKTTYDADANHAYPIEYKYCGLDGKPQATTDCYAIKKCQYDKEGYWTEESYFDADGNACGDKSGTHRVVLKRENNGNKLILEHYDVHGKPCLNAKRYFRAIAEIDEEKRTSLFSFYGTDGRPLYRKDLKAHSLRLTFNGQGDIIEAENVPPTGENNPLPQGYYSRIRVMRDSWGNITKQCFYRRDALQHERKVFSISTTYDPSGNISTEKTIYEGNTEGFSLGQGYTMVKLSWDPKGNKIREEYRDSDGKTPCENEHGVACIRWEYDEEKRITRQYHYNRDQAPCAGEFGSHCHEWKTNAHGKKMQEMHYGNNDEPVFCRDGYFEVRRQWDQFGNLIEEAYYDTSGRPLLNANGIARLKLLYDKRGYIKSEDSLDTEGNLCVNVEGYARQTFQYDSLNRLIQKSFFAPNLQPCTGNEGYSIVKLEYDENGYLSREAYYGTNGLPCLNKKGYAAVAWQYNNQGEIIRESYTGLHNEPILCVEGYASILFTYNTAGLLLGKSYLGLTGQPCTNLDGEGGFRYIYENDTFITGIIILNTDNNEYAINEYSRVEYKYDNYLRATEAAYYTLSEGKKTAAQKDGYHRVTFCYDSRGNVIKERYYDAQRNPDKDINGCFGKDMQYDDRDRLVRECYLDADEKPVMLANGYAQIQYKYDNQSHISELHYLNASGDPCTSEGCASILFRHNQAGQVISKHFLDEKGDPCCNAEGYAQADLFYNDKGEQVEERHYALSDLQHKIPGSYIRSEYNDRGLVQKITYDVRNKETLSLPGEIREEQFTYDQNGKLTESAWYGADGNLCLNTDLQAARVTCAYNEQGELCEEAYFNTSNHRTMSAEGYSLLYLHRNKYGKVEEESYYDAGDFPCDRHGVGSMIIREWDKNGNIICESFFDSHDENLPISKRSNRSATTNN